jgi:hypothetical protein
MAHRSLINKIVNVQLTIIFDQRMIPRLAYLHLKKVQIGRFRGVAQPGSATALGAVGREFESLHPDQLLKWSVRNLIRYVNSAFIMLTVLKNQP